MMMVYQLKLSVIIWRATKCFKPSDRVSSPPSVILSQLRNIRSQMNSGYCYSLLVEIKSNCVYSCKMPEAL